MATLSLPLTFSNSFWSQDYRTGFQVLFNKLEQGSDENAEIIEFLKRRIESEERQAHDLTHVGLATRSKSGFNHDEGASLLTTFRGLQEETFTQGQKHKAIAQELRTLVSEPFEKWAHGYKDRLMTSRATVMDSWLRSYEQSQRDVGKLKESYISKTRRADDAEDDAKFAPVTNDIDDKYTSSPRLQHVDLQTPRRTGSVSERITRRLREIQKKDSDAIAPSPFQVSPDISGNPLPKVDKGKGRVIDDASSTVDPVASASPTKEESSRDDSSITAGGVVFTPSQLSNLITRAATELRMRSVRFPLLGEYQDSFHGTEFVEWLNRHVPELEGNLDAAEDMAKDLTEKEGLLRRLGELGNMFEYSDVAFYQFRPKAFNLDDRTENNTMKPFMKTESLMKNSIANFVSKALSNGNSSKEPFYVRARQEAEDAGDACRYATRLLDRQRLVLEERAEETLKTLNRWELERLRAVKIVLLQYQGILSNLPKSYEPSLDRSATLIATFQPESDLSALIERYRTGPFRPDPQVYESLSHVACDVVFGIDLRKWGERGWEELRTSDQHETIPEVFSALLKGASVAYEGVNDEERRKSWIYEVPLPAVHRLRENLNHISADKPIPANLFASYDAPVIAATIKLWLLELTPPLALYEGWTDFRVLYPNLGSTIKSEGEEKGQERLKDLSNALQKLPKVHLLVLDALIRHLKNLIATTTVAETNDIYTTKLAVSIGRCIMRPKVETSVSIQDRHPIMFFMDLMNNYDALLPPTIERKKRETARKMPVRRRTALVDMRMSRTKIEVGMSPSWSNNSLPKSPTQPRRGSTSTTMSSPSHILTSSKRVSHDSNIDIPSFNATLNQVAPEIEISPIILPPSPEMPRPLFKDPPVEHDDYECVQDKANQDSAIPPSFSEPALGGDPEIDLRSSPKPPPVVEKLHTLPEVEKRVPSPTGTPAMTPKSQIAESEPIVVAPAPSGTFARPLAKSSDTSGRSSPALGVSSLRKTSDSVTSAEQGDVTLGIGGTSLSRHGSGQQAVIGRRPRPVARGPRAIGNGDSKKVQSMASSINVGHQRVKSGDRESLVRRPSMVTGGRMPMLSRRTMASDAEDEVVDRN